MDILELFKALRAEWSTVTTHQEAFFVAVGAGLLVGWTVAWLILRQRLTHHRELIEHYKDALVDKAPTPLSSQQNLGLSRGRFIFGLIFIAVLTVIPTVVKTFQEKPSGFSRIQMLNLQVLAAEDPVKFNLYLQSTGSLAALALAHTDVTAIVEQEPSHQDLDAIFEALKAKRAEFINKSSAEIQPSEIVWYTVPFSVEKSQYDQIQNGPYYLYIFSYITYRDATGDRENVTEMCYFTYRGQAFHRCDSHNKIYRLR